MPEPEYAANGGTSGNGGGGFSLLELLAVVAITGMLLAFAVPAYEDYAERGRRVTALAALHEIAARQEQHYLEHLAYAATVEALGHPARTADGAYALAITEADAWSFTAEARAEPGGPQDGDEECPLLRLEANGRRLALDRDGVERTTVCWR